MYRCAQSVALRQGDSVRIRRGVLIGRRGRLVDLDGNPDDDARATVVLDLFGCDVTARLESSLLEADVEDTRA